MLAQTVKCALRAALHVAGETPQARTTEQIAKATRVPRAYLVEVLQRLKRAGLIRAQRGMGGGMTLAKSANEVTVLEVVNAVDLEAHGARLCALHQRLDNARGSWKTRFQVRP